MTKKQEWESGFNGKGVKEGKVQKLKGNFTSHQCKGKRETVKRDHPKKISLREAPEGERPEGEENGVTKHHWGSKRLRRQQQSQTAAARKTRKEKRKKKKKKRPPDQWKKEPLRDKGGKACV